MLKSLGFSPLHGLGKIEVSRVPTVRVDRILTSCVCMPITMQPFNVLLMVLVGIPTMQGAMSPPGASRSQTATESSESDCKAFPSPTSCRCLTIS